MHPLWSYFLLNWKRTTYCSDHKDPSAPYNSSEQKEERKLHLQWNHQIKKSKGSYWEKCILKALRLIGNSEKKSRNPTQKEKYEIIHCRKPSGNKICKYSRICPSASSSGFTLHHSVLHRCYKTTNIQILAWQMSQNSTAAQGIYGKIKEHLEGQTVLHTGVKRLSSLPGIRQERVLYVSGENEGS